MELWNHAFGEPFKPGPDYIYVCNVLYEMGVYANVEVLDMEMRRYFANMEEVVTYWRDILEISKEKAEKIVIPYMSKKLVNKPEGLEQTSFSKTAMIWWKK
jgi:hypothetical protein